MFLQNMGHVATLVAELFILIGVGVLCGKIKWLQDSGAKQISNLLFYVVTFCLILESFLSVEFSAERVKVMVIAAGGCVLCTVVGLLCLLPLYRKYDRSKKAPLRFGTIFSNCGFLGIPLTSSILGAEGVFIVAVYVATFQILIWTVGVNFYQTPKKSLILKNLLLNPGIISVAAGLPLFFFQVKCPAIIMAPINMLADLNAPLAMMVTGYYLGKTKLRLLPGDGSILLGIFLRLLLIPAITVGGLYLLGLRGLPLVAISIPVCAPTASNTSMFAVLFGADEVYGARMVSLCTLLSIFTMPVIIALTQTIA